MLNNTPFHSSFNNNNSSNNNKSHPSLYPGQLNSHLQQMSHHQQQQQQQLPPQSPLSSPLLKKPQQHLYFSSNDVQEMEEEDFDPTQYYFKRQQQQQQQQHQQQQVAQQLLLQQQMLFQKMQQDPIATSSNRFIVDDINSSSNSNSSAPLSSVSLHQQQQQPPPPLSPSPSLSAQQQQQQQQMNFMQNFTSQNLQNFGTGNAMGQNIHPAQLTAQQQQQQQQFLLQQQQSYLLQQQQQQQQQYQQQQQTLQGFIQNNPSRAANGTTVNAATNPTIPSSPYRPSDTIMSIINKQQQMPPQPTTTSNLPTNPMQKTMGGTSKMTSKYGLLGLLSVISMQDADLNALALGSDLTTLGLNLNSREYLYTNFSSPWNDQKSYIEPEFSVPNCYKTHGHMELREQYIDNFKDETLFYIFYSMPRDAMQMIAARELQKRGWTWIRENHLWIKESTGEYFDVAGWKKNSVGTVVLSSLIQHTNLQPESGHIDETQVSNDDLHNYVNQIAKDENERANFNHNGTQQKGSSDIAKQGEM